MENLLLCSYEFICSAFPALAAFAVLVARSRRGTCAMPTSVAIAYAAYLCVLLHLTGAGTLHDAVRFGIDLNGSQLSLVPFAGFAEDVAGHVLNVLLFVPLGAFVAWSAGRGAKARTAVVLGACMSIAVELSQLMNSRVLDVDDLLMNAFGALLGFALCLAATKAVKVDREERSSLHAVAAISVAAFLGRFLLFDEMGAAKILFGF